MEKENFGRGYNYISSTCILNMVLCQSTVDCGVPSNHANMYNYILYIIIYNMFSVSPEKLSDSNIDGNGCLLGCSPV